jgi:RelA/SpoT family (p)ppGpp synthetase
LITADDLIAKVQSYNPKADAELIRRAYAFGKEAHEGQFRKSGEPYFTHPVAVAMLLTEVKLDDATIVTALLHDTVEDTKATYQQVVNLFSPEIAQLVDGVTKLTNLELSSVETKQAENFRKLLMAMSKDLRVLLVKLADRLHNMRTIKSMSKEKQRLKARETIEIYAPLAGRMGMQFIREELEDLCFRVLNPEARNSIMRRFINLSKENDDLIPRITEDIRVALHNSGVEARVTGREKRPYSIWRKMQEKNEPFNRLSDIYAFRIITDNVQDAYIALGAVHQRWNAVPGRFKDYISQPKSNGYRSIHTTVSGRNAKRVEVQIRTREMHQVAESGVAAHWSYRDGERAENPFAVDPFHWLRSLAERFEASENPDEFLEHVKLEMFQDQVFCFTPKGEVIKLPRGASPIDFAYAIHTRIGDSCVGAKVNGQRVPLWTKLRNGQSVEIIRAEGQRPQASWEDMVVTGRAKSSIRRYLRDEHREAHIRLGREIARVSLGRVGKKPTDKALETAANLFNLPSDETLLAEIGAAQISGAELVQTLYPELVKSGSMPGPGPDEDRVIGLSPNQSATPAPCCTPVPGERIVGIAMPGRGVLIHAIDCPILEGFEGNDSRWVDLRWTPDSSLACNETKIEVAMANDAGVLGRICTLIGEHRSNIVNIEFTARKPDFYRIRLDIMVRDIEHLTNVKTALNADSDVAEVLRYRDTSLCELSEQDGKR